MIKKIIPSPLRLRLRVLQKELKDIVEGNRNKLMRLSAANVSFPSQLQISQPIRHNSYSNNKIHNLQVATAVIGNKMIAPNQIFSFWKLIPKPIQANGFKRGRNLIGDSLSADYGGGLCQLSGILYHLSLMAGLKIIERHPHSKDIYTEATRYTPLGSDATVVYGHKDLRIQNCLAQPISFHFEIKQEEIIAHCCAEVAIDIQQLFFEADDKGKASIAKVYAMHRTGKTLISKDIYEKL